MSRIKYRENIEGSFFVDNECIACDTCVSIAPENFVLTTDNDHAYVFKQPLNQDQTKKCHKALEECPVDAIGFDV